MDKKTLLSKLKSGKSLADIAKARCKGIYVKVEYGTSDTIQTGPSCQGREIGSSEREKDPLPSEQEVRQGDQP